MYAVESISSRIAMVEKSTSSERVWLVLHADTGPYLIGAWYRPPSPGEIDSINAFKEEWQRLSFHVLGSILVGDLNVHHIRWLRHSTRNSAEGELLRDFCDRVGLRQIVREPTRNGNLLDLALTDLDEVRCKVIAKVADHSGLALALPIPAPRVEIQCRLVWQFREADWDGLNNALSSQDWAWLRTVSANVGAEQLTSMILALAERFIPRRYLYERKSTHPWINDRVLKTVREKHASQGTAMEESCRERCSKCIMEEYDKYVASSFTAKEMSK